MYLAVTDVVTRAKNFEMRLAPISSKLAFLDMLMNLEVEDFDH